MKKDSTLLETVQGRAEQQSKTHAMVRRASSGGNDTEMCQRCRILGIDPGTGILGFGVVDFEKGKKPKMIDAGVITTPAHTPLDQRLLEIFNSLTEIVEATKPDVMSIEKLFFAQNITTAISVSHARGVAMLVGVRANLSIFEYTPLQIKQTLTGYGRADKKQIQEMVKIHLGLKTAPKPDDCADALATAITHNLMSKV